MKMRSVVLLVLVSVLVMGVMLTRTWGVSAQRPETPSSPLLPLSPRYTPLLSTLDVTPAALGQPGFSLRYLRTFGTSEVGYLEDTFHLWYPIGVATEGNNVWIAEAYGLRAMKYTGSGSFVQQIGRGGFRFGAGSSNRDLEWLSDVAVDKSGNVWIVDGVVHHVLKFDANGNYLGKLGQQWSSGPGNDQFNGPHSIAFDSVNNIYVSDTYNHRIQVFTSNGTYLATIGVSGVAGADNAHFNTPERIAIDQNDYLYVADSGNHRIQVFHSSRVHLATIGVSGVPGDDNSHFNTPNGVAVDANRIYVADWNNHRVQVFDRATRTYQATIGTGTAGAGNNQLALPADVAVDTAGNLYVADFLNHRVQQFNSALAYVRTYGTTGVPYRTDNLHYNRPAGVAVATDGSLYVLEDRGARLVKLDAAGTPQWSIGEAGVDGSDHNHFAGASDVDVDTLGRAYVADTWNHRVQVFHSDGSYLTTLGQGQGTGNNQFDGARGVAVDSNGNVYVADTYNHRVQIYNNRFTYVATLGQTGLPGSGNNQFNTPYDVATDQAGNIYVADQNNHRVQVFNSSRAYVRTIGQTGVAGQDFEHLANPAAVAVDSAGRIYVADNWGNRVQVFDRNGAYLTTVGNSSGSDSGQMRDVAGLALDNDDNLYTAEMLNHRLQKFAPGVPGWVQNNLNGFGNRENSYVLALAPFGGYLYASVYNWVSGSSAQLWRRSATGNWAAVMTNGFGVADNSYIDHLFTFNNQLYAGTCNEANGGEVWRSSNGTTWTRVVNRGFGDPNNAEVFRFVRFNNQLYASVWSYTTTHGLEIWRSSTGNSGSWSRVASNGFNGDVNNVGVATFEVFDGYLYAGTLNFITGGEVWRTSNGTTWTQVNSDGFGTANNQAISALAVWGSYLYASTVGSAGFGIQVWRCQVCNGSDWQNVVDNGFGNSQTRGLTSLEGAGDWLYLIASNRSTGPEVWRTTNGTNWTQVGFGGFGDSTNNNIYWDNATTVFNNRLYVGTINYAQGGEIWKRTVTADFTASPVEGAPPLTVTFTNHSGGDYTSSQWGFGDGTTSALTHPTHTYTRTGQFTVTLTVSDGVENSTLIRNRLIRLQQRLYLPLVLRQAGPAL